MGVPIRVPTSVIIRLPAMALSRPPELPGGGVICTNTTGVSAGSPWSNSVNNIQHSQNRPNSMASTETDSPAALMMRRRVYKLSMAFAQSLLCSVAFALPQLVKHVARDGQDDEGDEEQDQAEFDQRGCVEFADRLVEFIGQCRGNAIAGHQQRLAQFMGIADHEGDRHGFAQCAPEPQHD